MKKVILITGASSGIGRATAIRLQQAGNLVYAAARRIERLQPLAKYGIRPLVLDLTQPATLEQAVATIQQQTGRLDVLINNAGYGAYGAIETVPISTAKRQFEVNLFGTARLIQIVLPIMRAQHSGRIINVTSIAGKIYQPLGGWYVATKHALEGLSDTLRSEVKQFGIQVVLIEPGLIQTEWAKIADQNLQTNTTAAAYAPLTAKTDALLKFAYRWASDPNVIAQVMVKAVTSRRPRTRYAAGFGSHLTLTSRRILSDRQFDAMLGVALSTCLALSRHHK